MADTTAIPSHPFITQLLTSIKTAGEDKLVIPSSILASCKSRLLTELASEPVVFLQLIVLWSDFLEQQFEPAAAQLFELLSLCPQVEKNASREALLAEAQKARQKIQQGAIERVGATLAPSSNRSGVSLGGKKKR
jgi:hypothetical protein